MIIKIAIGMLAVYLLGFYTNAAIEADARRKEQRMQVREIRLWIQRAWARERKRKARR